MNQQFKKVFACTAGPEYYEFFVRSIANFSWNRTNRILSYL